MTDPEATDHVAEAARQIQQAAEAKKCWSCGCLHDTLDAIERSFPGGDVPPVLRPQVELARGRLVEVEYDCIGCKVCFPALAVNHLNQSPGIGVELDACAAEVAEAREGWPPLPGDCTVLRYQAPVAVCTLTDSALVQAVAGESSQAIAIVGSMQTENLGIERAILNILANPNIRFLIVCGQDSEQAIGHLPGQALVSLSKNGLDKGARIIGAQGKRPVIKNVASTAIEHFRSNVEIIDCIGERRKENILRVANECLARNPGPGDPYDPGQAVKATRGSLPERMIPDPEGYFVVYVDESRHKLSLEHFSTDGVLTAIIEGKTAVELYLPAIEGGMVSRLDHAAYLGKELSRAERCLKDGEVFIQDAAPEVASQSGGCGCSSPCSEEGS